VWQSRSPVVPGDKRLERELWLWVSEWVWVVMWVLVEV